MNDQSATIQYQRRGDTGTLRLTGVIDIFEVGALHEAALKALADEKAQNLRIQAADAERMDLTAAQMLVALRREVVAKGRTFALDNAPENLKQTLAWVSLADETR